MTELTVPANEKDHTVGNAKAPVTLVMYGDYECPFCIQASGVITELKADLGNGLRFAFRNFPLSELHPYALEAAQAAEAAGKQGRFWEMHNLLFARQSSLESHNLMRYAYTLGLDMERFLDDAASHVVTKKIHDDFWSGIRSGVNGTPTFFVNGIRHDGTYAYGDLRAAIERAAGAGVSVR